MSLLARSYRAAGHHDPLRPEPADLEAKLAALCARGRAAHPELVLDGPSFAAHLGRLQASLLEASDALEAGDLFLACAALTGVAGAVEKLQAQCWPAVIRYLRPLSSAEAFADEIGQQLWESLLVGRVGTRPTLATYSGRGPLTRFIGITARRMALLGLRRHKAQVRATARGISETPTATHDVELAMIKSRYREAFQQALEESLRVLDDRDREILRLHVAEGLTVDRIAKTFGVSQSTVSRWMAGARKRVLGEARRLLRKRLPLSESEFDSLANLLASQIELSLSHVAPVRR